MAEERVAREEHTISNQVKDVENGGSSSTTTTTMTSSSTDTKTNKGKSCKGCLYYSSSLKSNTRNPLCVGLTRSLPEVPRYIARGSEIGGSKERDLSYFKYGCVGYSVYPDHKKNPASDAQDSQTELPLCVGLEVLVDRKVNNAESSPAHMHNKQDGHGLPPLRPQKPAHSVGDEFLTRFTRNANLVAMGVVKNMRKVGNQIKESVDGVLYPYRSKPK